MQSVARSLRQALTAFALFAVTGATVLDAAETPFSRVATPTNGKPAALGGPANGCLSGASTLPAEGTGFVSIRRHRNRYYGHPQTVAFVQDLGRYVAARGDGLIMVGDLAQPRGGRMSSSHRSHQNGLDADIWLTLATSPRQARSSTPEERDPPSMLSGNGLGVNQRWGAVQRAMVKRAAEDPRVDRIFVNPGIKRALCRTETNKNWLRKLRPWWGHDAHFHVRLKCPKGSPACKPQSPVPMGSGCGSELAWWFSLEARKPAKKKSKPRPSPKPPAACTALLKR